MTSYSQVSEGEDRHEQFGSLGQQSSLEIDTFKSEFPPSEEFYAEVSDKDFTKDVIDNDATMQVDEEEMAVGHALLREAIRRMRDRRREGYEDKARVQRKIGRRKVKAIRQRVRKGHKEHRDTELEPEETVPASYNDCSPVYGSSSTSDAVYNPPSPANTPLATSTANLLAELRAIEKSPPKNPPKVVLDYDIAMESPVSSPMILSNKERGLRIMEAAPILHRRFVDMMDYQRENKGPSHGPFDLHEEDRGDMSCRISETPSP
ncbi:hypothetical protein BDZ91DRAFT_713853 [Kalaharituber pfeilii]|nr:hypothetical protein BDZ91DRAFT_713853 [Kalaharituber pfeilii]